MRRIHRPDRPPERSDPPPRGARARWTTRSAVLAAVLTLGTAGLSVATASPSLAQETDTTEAEAGDPAPSGSGVLCTPRSSDRAVVEGTLRERASGAPLGGGEILLTVLPASDADSMIERSAVPNGVGRFRFCDLPPGRSARVTARYGGTMSAMRTVELVAGETSDVELRITGGRLTYVLGWVRDTGEDQPVEEATVRLQPGGGSAVTDEHGRFVLPRVGDGAYTLTVQRGEASPRSVDLAIEGGTGLELEVALPPDDSAEGSLDVSAETHPAHLMRTGFYERMRLGTGQYLTPEEVESRRRYGIDDVLRALPSVRAPRCRRANCVIIPRTTSGCRMSIWVNGQHLRSGGLERVPARNLLAVEAYRRRAGTPEPFRDPFNSCGSLVLWTGP